MAAQTLDNGADPPPSALGKVDPTSCMGITVEQPPAVVVPWTQAWPLLAARVWMSPCPQVARSAPTSACFSLPSLLPVYIFPQQANHSAALERAAPCDKAPEEIKGKKKKNSSFGSIACGSLVKHSLIMGTMQRAKLLTST